MALAPPPLHVLHISRVGFLGGAERVILTLIEGHKEAHRISLAAPSEGDLIVAAAGRGASTVSVDFDRMRATANPIALWRYGVSWARASRHLTSYCRSERVGLIHAHHPVGVLYAIPAARRLNIPIVLHVHEMLPAKTLYALALRASARHVDRFICVSQAAVELLESLGLRDDRVTLIPNGVDWHFLRATKPASEVTGKGPHIAVFGVLEPRKGQDIFLAAAELVLQACPSAKFWLVGGLALKDKGAFLRRLEALAEQPILKGRVTLTGHREDVSRWMAAMDVVALTSVAHESMGMVLVEAMALGKPVVSTRIGVTDTLVKEGETGFLAPSGDPEGLARAIVKLLHADRYAMGRRAAEDVRARFSPSRFCSSVLDAYDGLMLGQCSRGVVNAPTATGNANRS